MFAYCGNNPVIRIDPDGCFFVELYVDPIAEFFSDVGFWIKDQLLEWHYSRNDQNQLPAEEDISDIVVNNHEDWYEVDDDLNRYHRFPDGEQGEDAKYNKKYMTHDKKNEVIICYNAEANVGPYIVTDPVNAGTYNRGTNIASHFILDVVPYWFFGNSPADSTTGWERIWGVS